jgi:hypothetical protein
VVAIDEEWPAVAVLPVVVTAGDTKERGGDGYLPLSGLSAPALHWSSFGGMARHWVRGVVHGVVAPGWWGSRGRHTASAAR